MLKSGNLLVCLSVLCTALLISCTKPATAKQQLEKFLGISVPSNGPVDLWYKKVPDYNHYDVAARFPANYPEWVLLIEKAKAHTSKDEVQQLPTGYRSQLNLTWWDAPSVENQQHLAIISGPQGTCRMLWHSNAVFLEFSGFPPAIRK